MATQTVQITQPQKLQTVFRVVLDPELAASLWEWFEKAVAGKPGEQIANIDMFAREILEITLADYRLEHLPPAAEETREARVLGKNKLTAAQKREICELFEEESEERCSVTELAARFHVGPTTIRRVLAEGEKDDE